MIEKEYYRFDELEKRFDLSFSDLQYLIENSKINLAFYLEKNKFVMGGWLKGKGFIGYASVSYKGLVRITLDEQLLLLSKKKINCKIFSLINKGNIQSHNLNYPFETPTPHNFLYDWRPKLTEDIEWDSIPAKLYPKESEHVIRSLSNMFSETFDKATKKEGEESAFMAKIPQMQFYSEGINFTLEDICILHSDIVSLGLNKPSIDTSIKGAKNVERTNQQTDKALNNPIKSYHRPIDILLLNILEIFPQDKPATLWDKLKNDLNNEPRQFDIDETLDEVGEKELYWYDIEGEAQSLKKKSFYNLIRNLKNI